MKHSRIISLLVAMSFVANAYSAVISEIHVRNRGVEATDRDYVLAYTDTRVGDDFDRRSIARDVKALEKTGRFSFIDTEVERLDNGTLSLIYTVELKPRLATPVEVTGAEIMGERKVRKYLELEPGDLVDDAIMTTRTASVLKEYQKRFFPEVKMTWEIKVDDVTGLADVTLNVDEGMRASIRKIRFVGNRKFSDRELRDQIKTGTWNIFSFFTKSGVYDPDMIEADRESIRRFYHDHGYLDVEVTQPNVFLSPKKLVVVFTVRENRQYKIGNISIKGNTLFTTEELDKTRTINTGDIASMKKMAGTRSAIRDYYQSRGYLNTRVAMNVQAVDTTPVVDVSYSIREGGLVYLRYIDIKGNTRTKDEVIRRELLVYPGEVFDQVKVRRSERILQNLGFFSSVVSYPRSTGKPDKEDLIYEVEEKSTGQFMIGAGYSSIDNLLGYVELAQGNFDLFGWPTFTGDGQKLRLRTQFGTERTDYELSFVEPWFLNRKLSLGVDLYQHERGYLSSEYNERRTGGAITLGKPLRGFFRRVNFRYGLEEINIYDISDDASDWIQDEAGRRTTSSLKVTFIHDTRDSVFLPSRGTRFTVGGHFSGGPLGFDTHVYGFESRVSHYIPLWFKHVFTLRGLAEVVQEYDGDEDVHIFDRLFLGGARTLRGFKYRHAGPLDENGEPVGGKTCAEGTAEYTMPLVKPLRFATFYDIGNVWSDAYDFDLPTYYSDAGIGLRLDIPGFPVQLDYAWPLEIPEGVERGSARFNFSIGYAY